MKMVWGDKEHPGWLLELSALVERHHLTAKLLYCSHVQFHLQVGCIRMEACVLD